MATIVAAWLAVKTWVHTGLQRVAALTDQAWTGVRAKLGYTFDFATSQAYGGNALVYACVEAIATSVPAVQLVVKRPTGAGELEPVPDHPLDQLLRRPNRFYSRYRLLHTSIVYYTLGGDLFLWKGRNGAGRVVELWPLRPDLVIPFQYPESENWIDYYQYTIGGRRIEIPVEDMVHIPNGVDPINPRRGLSPLVPILAEISLDRAATEHVAALLDNYAAPGVVLSTKGRLTAQQADELKRKFQVKYGGARRGEPAVVDSDTSIVTTSMTPQQLELPDLREISETRICAAFGVPPIVVGAWSGLKRSTFSNYGEARESFWDECIQPLIQQLVDEINAQLLPDFDQRAVVEADYSGVRAFQEDESAVWDRALRGWQAGAITRNQFLAAIGKAEEPDGDVYLIPVSGSLTPAGMADGQPAAVTQPQQPAGAQEPGGIPDPTGETIPVQGGPAPRRPGKSKVVPLERKAPHAQNLANQRRLADFLVRVRKHLEPGLASELAGYFERLANRVVDRALSGQKAALPNPDDLITDRDRAELGRILTNAYALALELAWERVGAQLGVQVAWDVHDPFVQRFLAGAGARVKDITETTLGEIRTTLREGERRGLGVDQLVRGVTDPDTGETLVRGLRDVVAQTYKGRAQNIAATELGHAVNRGTVARYRDSGVVLAVRVFDGTEHDDACAEVNGTIQTLDWADANPLQHPRCSRSMAPVVDASELPAGWDAGEEGAA